MTHAEVLERAYREADAAAVYREAGYAGFATPEGVAYLEACNRLGVASSARFAAREVLR